MKIARNPGSRHFSLQKIWMQLFKSEKGVNPDNLNRLRPLVQSYIPLTGERNQCFCMLATSSLEWLFLGYRILGRLHLLVVYSHFSRYGTTAGQYWLEKAVFRFSASPPPIAHHCVSGVSVLHLALLYPGSVSQRIPVSHVRR